MVRRDKERSSFLVALPRCDDGAWLLRPAAVVDELLDAVIFADVEVPGIAGRVTAVRGILHRHQLSRAVANGQLFHALIGHRGAPVPVSMEGEQKPIVIVDESGIDFVFYGVGLAAELGAQVGSLDRLTVLVLSLVGDFVGLGLPLPRTGDTYSGELRVPRITDRFNLPERIKAIGLGNLFGIGLGSLFGDGRAFLRAGVRSKEEHPKNQETECL